MPILNGTCYLYGESILLKFNVRSTKSGKYPILFHEWPISNFFCDSGEHTRYSGWIRAHFFILLRPLVRFNTQPQRLDNEYQLNKSDTSTFWCTHLDYASDSKSHKNYSNKMYKYIKIWNFKFHRFVFSSFKVFDATISYTKRKKKKISLSLTQRICIFFSF